MPDTVELQLAVWEKTVDVQMHFNDICMRLRAVAISAIGVLLGAAALSYRYAGNFQLSEVSIPYFVPAFFAFLLVFIFVVAVNPARGRIGKLAFDLVGTLVLLAILWLSPAFPEFHIKDWTIPIAVLFIAIAICLNLGFWWLDRYWYHQLLRGAVDHNKEMERLLEALVPGIGLAASIKARGDDAVFGLRIPGGRRISLFYALITLVLLATLVLTLYATGG